MKDWYPPHSEWGGVFLSGIFISRVYRGPLLLGTYWLGFVA